MGRNKFAGGQECCTKLERRLPQGVVYCYACVSDMAFVSPFSLAFASLQGWIVPLASWHRAHITTRRLLSVVFEIM